MDKAVSKQALASVCVYAEQILGIWDNYEAKIRQIRKCATYSSHTVVLADLEKENKDLMLKLEPLMQKLIKKRNEQIDYMGNRLKPLEAWTNTSDIFNNIVEGLKNEQTNEVEESNSIKKLQEAVDGWRTGYEKCKEELDNLKVNYAAANTKLSEFQQSQIKMNSSKDEEDFKVMPGSSLDTSEKKTTSYRIDGKTPIFKSKNDEDVENWLYKVETALEFAQVPRNMWLVAVSNYVEGTALEMLKQSRDVKKSWNDFKKDLLNTFRPIQKDFDLRSKLTQLKDDDSYEKYLHEFRSLSNQIPNNKMSETDRLTCFLQGLRAKTRAELFLRDVKSLDDAIKVATILESVRKQAGDMKPKLEVNSINKGKNLTCYRCKLKGHIAANCRVELEEEESEEESDDTTESNEKLGNTSEKKMFKNSVNKKIDNGKKLKYPHLKCNKCGKNGHTSEYCHSASRKEVRISSVETDIDGFDLNLVETDEDLVENNSVVFLNKMEVKVDEDKISSDEDEVLRQTSPDGVMMRFTEMNSIEHFNLTNETHEKTLDEMVEIKKVY